MAAKQMIKQQKGGIIINMSSIGAKGFSDVSNAIYASSKGAVLSLTNLVGSSAGLKADRTQMNIGRMPVARM